MRGGKRELRLTGGDDPKFRAMVRKLDQEYVDRFGETALQYRPYNTLEKIEAACLLIVDGTPAACGAIQPLDEDTAELKRVYVLPEFRRRGLARQVVEQLELQALFHGYQFMALETGRAMPEAVALYTKLGYRETKPWGPFAGQAVPVHEKGAHLIFRRKGRTRHGLPASRRRNTAQNPG